MHFRTLVVLEEWLRLFTTMNGETAMVRPSWFALVVIIFAAISSPTAAADNPGKHEGKVVTYGLDAASAAQGRGACIQMQPEIPEAKGWGCVWNDNPLFDEFNAFMLASYVHGKTCFIRWLSRDQNSHVKLTLFECH